MKKKDLDAIIVEYKRTQKTNRPQAESNEKLSAVVKAIRLSIQNSNMDERRQA